MFKDFFCNDLKKKTTYFYNYYLINFSRGELAKTGIFLSSYIISKHIKPTFVCQKKFGVFTMTRHFQFNKGKEGIFLREYSSR